MRKKILFVIHDLHHGGAEKVLVNLVNHMDQDRFDISILALFGGGVNEQFLSPKVRLLHGHSRSIPGNSKIMKLFSPKQLFHYYIKEKYDIIISYLEGPSARIVSGCPHDGTKLVSWVHCTIKSEQEISVGFRNFKEANLCYQKFDCHVFVSNGVKDAFCKLISLSSPCVLYNTIDSANIINMSGQPVQPDAFPEDQYKLVAVGKLEKVKGFERLLRVHKRLLTQDHLPVHLYLLGEGVEKKALETWVMEHGLESSVTFLGYQTNPYQYIAACDLFVCSSYSEGFSTAATEALIIGTPVVATRVSGMEEMLGKNEYGIIAENSEEDLYCAIKQMLTSPELLQKYKAAAQKRGEIFSTEKTVLAVEEMFRKILEPGKVNSKC